MSVVAIEPRGEELQTTKIRPKSLTKVYFNVYLSYLYVGLLEACGVGRTLSSIKTSLMRLLTAVAPIFELDLDQRTTPEVVKISKASSILRLVFELPGRRDSVFVRMFPLED